MKKLFIDIDDVVCSNSVLPTINEILQTNYSFDDFKTFYMQEVIPEDKKEEFFKLFTTRNLYYKCVFKDNVIVTIEKLNKYFDVYFISTAFSKGAEGKVARFFGDKYNLIVTNFPFIDERKIIFTYEKSLINGDIIVDDSIRNLTSNYKIKLLFTAYHNKDITDQQLAEINAVRVNNWIEVEKYLISFVAHKSTN